MRAKLNFREPCITVPELFPETNSKISSLRLYKTSTKALELYNLNERLEYFNRVVSNCDPCFRGIVTAYGCLFLDVETYTKQEFIRDIENYFSNLTLLYA